MFSLRGQLREAEATSVSLVKTISAVPHTEHASLGHLTRQERRVAVYAASGASDAAIAIALGLSVNTVKCHMKAALRKLSLHSRWELAHILDEPAVIPLGSSGLRDRNDVLRTPAVSQRLANTHQR